MIADDEAIDEFGNSWNPSDHPRRDEKIGRDPYGVAINTDGVAKVFRLGSQTLRFEYYFRLQFLLY